MIIETQKKLDIENIGIATENIEANIDVASMPFLFEMLSGSLYSNAIGSICRELTSNCFDSHIEAKVDDPVIVKKGNDEEGTYISFIDVGVGLSPDRIKNIYMNYFSSTKRNTNDLIGGFGLGSKSPLSYADYFYIITIYDNIKYQYIFSKGTHVPTLDLIDTSEINQHNGTEIRIYIKSLEDEYKFEDELKKQLCYFDNVYFEGWNIENNYTIFEGTYFKYRNKNQYDKYMHIVLDKVTYPIDWKQLNIAPYNIAVGVKFEIGELQVTPNREQLRYTDEIIDLVKKRIRLTIDELVSIFDKQNTQFESFFKWLEKKDKDPHITFTKENEESKLYLYGLDNVKKKNIYKYFEGIEDIINYHDILSIFYGYIGEVSFGKRKKEKYTRDDITYLLKHHSCCLSNSPYTSADKDWLIRNGKIIYPRLKLPNGIFIKYDKSNNTFDRPRYFNLGTGLKLYKLMKALREEVVLKCRPYRELTEQEKIEYKEYKKENDGNLQRKLNGKVLVYSMLKQDSFEFNLYSLDKYTGFVIYGFRENEEQLKKAITILKEVRNKWFSAFTHTSKVIMVLRISKQNEKYFKKRKNMVHVNDFYGDNPIFRDMASSFKIEYFFNDINNHSSQNTYDYIKSMKLIYSDIGDVLQELYDFYNKTKDNNNSRQWYNRGNIKTEVIQIAEKYNLYNPKVELLFNKINSWFKDVEIIRYININDKTLPFVLKFLYEKKKRLNVEYYQRILNTDKSTQLEIDFNKKEEVPVTKFQIVTKNVLV